VLLAYVLIIALKLQRLQRDVAEIAEHVVKEREVERKAVAVG
jgi:hypothetical protein